MISALALAAATLAPAAGAEPWKIDGAHSSASFRVRHLMVSWVRGTITGLDGEVSINEQNQSASTVKASLDATSIDTRNAKRDEHLKSPDFLNTAKNPKINFASKAVSGSGSDLKVVGPLTLNGVTKDVELAVEGLTPAIKGMQGEMRRGLTATTKINRKDFNITWNKVLDGGGLAVGEEIEVTLEIELISGGKATH